MSRGNKELGRKAMKSYGLEREDEFLRAVLEMAGILGWRSTHDRRARPMDGGPR